MSLFLLSSFIIVHQICVIHVNVSLISATSCNTSGSLSFSVSI